MVIQSVDDGMMKCLIRLDSIDHWDCCWQVQWDLSHTMLNAGGEALSTES